MCYTTNLSLSQYLIYLVHFGSVRALFQHTLNIKNNVSVSGPMNVIIMSNAALKLCYVKLTVIGLMFTTNYSCCHNSLKLFCFHACSNWQKHIFCVLNRKGLIWKFHVQPLLENIFKWYVRRAKELLQHGLSFKYFKAIFGHCRYLHLYAFTVTHLSIQSCK